jgi:hypothetical protein
MAEIEYSLQIINYLSFAPSGATANFTNVTVIGLNAGSGTFTTVEATNYDDLVGNPWLTIANGGQPTLQNTLNVNGHSLTNIGGATFTGEADLYYQNLINLTATPTATSFYINTSGSTLPANTGSVALGVGAGNNLNASGQFNTFLGSGAGASSTSAAGNTYIGCNAGSNSNITDYNTCIGYEAGMNNANVGVCLLGRTQG